MKDLANNIYVIKLCSQNKTKVGLKERKDINEGRSCECQNKTKVGLKEEHFKEGVSRY